MSTTTKPRKKTLSYLEWLETYAQYQNIKTLPNGRWAALQNLMFTTAIIAGRMGDTMGYDLRWCYEDEASAAAALAAWNGSGEPTGWHREPNTGRRRPNGDPSKEYIER